MARSRTDEAARPRRAHEPLAYLAVAVATLAGAFEFLRYPFQPMQDLGHHMAIAAIVSDFAHPESLYPALYEAMSPLQGNSLLYSVAGPLGRLVGVTAAVRWLLAIAMAMVSPLTIVALRQSGRSAWPAVLAPALVHSLIFVAGFANLVFATPLILLVFVAHESLLAAPSRPRGALLAAGLAALFLAHVHAFLWVGALLAVRTLVAVGGAWGGSWGASTPGGARARVSFGWRQGLGSLAATVPALLLFARWYQRTFGSERAEGGVLTATGSLSTGFGATFRSLSEAWRDLPAFALELTHDESDLQFFAALALLVVASAFLSGRRPRASMAMPAAFTLTFLSYFVLPEGLRGHDIVASRQPGLAMLFLPALIVVPAWRSAPFARALVVTGLVSLTGFHFVTWGRLLSKFDAGECAGLEEVLNAAPPRRRLHYVKDNPESTVFAWRPFWHVEKFYMSMRLGQTADTPAVLSTGALRARAGVDLHRLTDHSSQWATNPELWANYDLVLLRHREPAVVPLFDLKKHAVLLVKRHDWEIWETRR